MTLVRFYILAEMHPTARDRFACKLAAIGHKEGVKTYLNMPSAEACKRIDELLWTFSDHSFIPHEICAGSEKSRSVISIGHNLEPADDFEVLINMADDVPHFFSRFQKTFEIIDARDEVKKAGRGRYAFYKDRGYPLDSHKV